MPECVRHIQAEFVKQFQRYMYVISVCWINHSFKKVTLKHEYLPQVIVVLFVANVCIRYPSLSAGNQNNHLIYFVL